MRIPKQNIIPKDVVDAYKILQEGKAKKQFTFLYGGRNVGKTMLTKLLTNNN